MPSRWRALLPPDEERGWADLNGHARFSHDPRTGQDPLVMEAFLRGAGLVTTNGSPHTLRMQALRFNRLIVAHMQADPIEVQWQRNRATARDRYMFAFVNRGALSFESASPFWTDEPGGLCIILPAEEPVLIRAQEPSDFIFFSFDRHEVLPYELTVINIDAAGRVSPALRAVYAYLAAITEQPQSVEDEKTSHILRTLTKDVARVVTLAALSDKIPHDIFTFARRAIHEHACTSTFNADKLAALCGVSRRTLAMMVVLSSMSDFDYAPAALDRE